MILAQTGVPVKRATWLLIISRPQSNAPSWSVTSLLRLQDRRSTDPAGAITGPLRSTDNTNCLIKGRAGYWARSGDLRPTEEWALL